MITEDRKVLFLMTVQEGFSEETGEYEIDLIDWVPVDFIDEKF